MRLRVDEYGRIARLHDKLMNPGGNAGKPEASANAMPFKLLQPCHDSATILI